MRKIYKVVLEKEEVELIRGTLIALIDKSEEWLYINKKINPSNNDIYIVKEEKALMENILKKIISKGRKNE